MDNEKNEITFTREELDKICIDIINEFTKYKLNAIYGLKQIHSANSDIRLLINIMYGHGLVSNNIYSSLSDGLSNAVTDTTRNLIILKEQAGGR